MLSIQKERMNEIPGVLILPLEDGDSSESVFDGPIALCMDVSLSTTGAILDTEEFHGRQLCYHFPNTTGWIDWSSEAGVRKSPKIRSVCNHTTVPVSIFQNPTSFKVLQDSQVVVFTTDGEISETERQTFCREIKRCGILDNKKLIICVRYGRSRDERMNITVFSPFMEHNNVVILGNYCDHTSMEVCHVQGIMARYLEEQTRIDWSTILTHIQNIDDYLKVIPIFPPGYTVLSTDLASETVTAIHWDTFLSTPLDDILSLGDTAWNQIIMSCKVSGTLPSLREQVVRWKEEHISRQPDLIQEHPERFALLLERRCLIETIQHLLQEESHQTDVIATHQERLRAILPLSREEEIESKRLRDESLSGIRSHWGRILEVIHEYEGSRFELSHLKRVANRAHRAGDVVEVSLDNMDFSKEGYPCDTCALSLEEDAPVVVFLNALDSETTSMILNDWTLNFPLDMDPTKLLESFVVNPVGGHCVQPYLESLRENKTLYRQDFVSCMPVQIKNNRHIIQTALAKAWSMGKDLPHLLFLLLRVVDSIPENHFLFPVKHFWKQDLLENLISYPDFSDSGDGRIKLPVLKILRHLSSECLSRQPAIASLFLIRLSLECHGEMVTFLVPEWIQTVITSMLCKALVPLLLQGEGLKCFRSKIYSYFFETFDGVPLLDCPLKDPTWQDLADLFPDAVFNRMNQELNGIFDLMNGYPGDEDPHRGSRIIPKDFLQEILLRLSSHVRKHAKCQQVIDIVFREMKYASVSNQPIHYRFNESIKRFIGESVQNMTPCFCANQGSRSGPSYLYFGVGENAKPLLDPESQKSLSEYFSLHGEDFMTWNLDENLQKLYGAVHPCTSSHHISIHRTVAETLTYHFPTETQVTPEMIIKCFRVLSKTFWESPFKAKGNIFRRSEIVDLVLLCKNFIDLRHSSEPIPIPDCLKRSDRIFAELQHHGVSPEVRLCDIPTLIPRPVDVIDMDLMSEEDVEEIIRKAQEELSL